MLYFYNKTEKFTIEFLRRPNSSIKVFANRTDMTLELYGRILKHTESIRRAYGRFTRYAKNAPPFMRRDDVIFYNRTFSLNTSHYKFKEEPTVRENEFQADLIKEIKSIFPGCIVLKNDANYLQGIPDLLILYGNKWAALECKISKNAVRQPLQEYYVNYMNNMSYASWIFPENKEDVLDELLQAFGA